MRYIGNTPCLYGKLIDGAQLKTLGEKVMDAANLGFGGLMLGQIVSKEFRFDWTLWGPAIWLGFYVGGSYLTYLQEQLMIKTKKYL